MIPRPLHLRGLLTHILHSIRADGPSHGTDHWWFYIGVTPRLMAMDRMDNSNHVWYTLVLAISLSTGDI